MGVPVPIAQVRSQAHEKPHLPAGLFCSLGSFRELFLDLLNAYSEVMYLVEQSGALPYLASKGLVNIRHHVEHRVDLLFESIESSVHNRQDFTLSLGNLIEHELGVFLLLHSAIVSHLFGL